MASAAFAPPLPIEWAVACRPMPGEALSGDLHLVEPFDGGVLVGVIDGLGHGPQAARVALQARHLIAALAGDPVEQIVKRCHAQLIGTRGVVLSLAALRANPPALTFSGIGNVEGVLLRATADEVQRRGLTSRGGVVGRDIPTPRVDSFPLEPGDLVLLTTDGIRQAYEAELDPAGSVDRLAALVCERHARATDDALVLAVRWRGGAPAPSA